MDAIDQPKLITLPGPRLCAEDKDTIRRLVYQCLEEGYCKLALDFSQVEFIDSSFLGFLVVALKRATAAGGDIRVCGLRKPVNSVFQLMRLNRIFEIYERPEQALESFNR